MTRRKIIQMFMALVLVIFLGVGGVLRSRTISHPSTGGETMGTSYTIKITGKVQQSQLKEIAQRVDSVLAEVNKQMSTWDPKSEISRFNHFQSLEPFQCSEAFSTVVRSSLKLSQKTGGAFDPTLQPLLNLWGFGSEAELSQVPDIAAITAAKNQTGWEKLRLDDSSNLWKKDPDLSLALGAIAKGYGVDAVGRVLSEAGLENWFVEIGGEVVVQGLNADGVPWKIGIQYPTTNPMDMRLQGVTHISSGAIATSGDYRNYIVEDDVVYSHLLDPRTGNAVRSSTASVTVFAPSCMMADGIATALFVMGPDEGLAWAEKTDQVEAMFLIRSEQGEINEQFSSGFKAATGYTEPL